MVEIKRLSMCPKVIRLNPEADGHESMCNPIGQAEILNVEKTEFNIVLGLCVGHDSMFLKNSDAMCTILAVKRSRHRA